MERVGEIWEVEHRTLHVSNGGRRDQLPHIPHTWGLVFETEGFVLLISVKNEED